MFLVFVNKHLLFSKFLHFWPKIFKFFSLCHLTSLHFHGSLSSAIIETVATKGINFLPVPAKLMRSVLLPSLPWAVKDLSLASG